MGTTPLPCPQSVCACVGLCACVSVFNYMHLCTQLSSLVLATVDDVYKEKCNFSVQISLGLIISSSLCRKFLILTFSHFLVLRYFLWKWKCWTDTITCSLWFISATKLDHHKSKWHGSRGKFTQFLSLSFFPFIWYEVITGPCCSGCWHSSINDWLVRGV